MLSKITYVIADSEKDVLSKDLDSFNTPEEASSCLNSKHYPNRRVYQKMILISEEGIDDP